MPDTRDPMAEVAGRRLIQQAGGGMVSLYGVPADRFTREELLAALVVLLREMDSERERLLDRAEAAMAHL